MAQYRVRNEYPGAWVAEARRWWFPAWLSLYATCDPKDEAGLLSLPITYDTEEEAKAACERHAT